MDEDPVLVISYSPEAQEALEQRFAGMRVVTSKWIPPGMALIVPAEVAGEANRRGFGLEDTHHPQ